MADKNTGTMSQRQKDLFFETLQMLRACVKPRFYDWKDADDWLFSELGFTKSELAEIFAGRGVLYYDGSAIDEKAPESLCVGREVGVSTNISTAANAACAAPLGREELISMGGKPVWAIMLRPKVDSDVPRAKGWGIVPEMDSFRQYLHQDFVLESCMMDEYGKKWIAFANEQNFDRFEEGEVCDP